MLTVPTEIYVPMLQFPNGFQVEINGEEIVVASAGQLVTLPVCSGPTRVIVSRLA